MDPPGANSTRAPHTTYDSWTPWTPTTPNEETAGVTVLLATTDDETGTTPHQRQAGTHQGGEVCSHKGSAKGVGQRQGENALCELQARQENVIRKTVNGDDW